MLEKITDSPASIVFERGDIAMVGAAKTVALAQADVVGPAPFAVTETLKYQVPVWVESVVVNGYDDVVTPLSVAPAQLDDGGELSSQLYV